MLASRRDTELGHSFDTSKSTDTLSDEAVFSEHGKSKAKVKGMVLTRLADTTRHSLPKSLCTSSVQKPF